MERNTKVEKMLEAADSRVFVQNRSNQENKTKKWIVFIRILPCRINDWRKDISSFIFDLIPFQVLKDSATLDIELMLICLQIMTFKISEIKSSRIFYQFKYLLLFKIPCYFTHTHTHAHIHIYIYIYVCIRVSGRGS